MVNLLRGTNYLTLLYRQAKRQVASLCIWHPIVVWETALVTEEAPGFVRRSTAGKLLYFIGFRPRRLPIYLVSLVEAVRVELHVKD